MNKKSLFAKYNENYTEENFFKENVTFAFSEAQLQEAMKKLGTPNRSELITIYGIGDVCLKSKAKEIVAWVEKHHQARIKWLQGLSEEEKSAIIEFEIHNHECTYTWEIEPALDLLQDVFGYDLIIQVWAKVKKGYYESGK